MRVEPFGRSGADPNERGLRILEDCPPDTVIAEFSGQLTPTATRHTIQVGPAQHLVVDPAVLQLVCHSCRPNVRFDVTERKLISVRAIRAADELTFFYPSTEWAMVAPFNCLCGEPECFHRIDGAKSIPRERLQSYWLAPHVRSQLA